MRNAVGLQAYFWLSLIAAFVAGYILPFQLKDHYTGMFLIFTVAPAIWLTTLLVNLILIARTRGEVFWKLMLLGLLAFAGCSVWAIFGPKDFEIAARKREVAFERAAGSYLFMVNKGEYRNAEIVFLEAVHANASDFPNKAVCVAAEKASLQGLAFTIKLQKRLKEQLARQDEQPCRAISWAVENGAIQVARTAIESGEVFGMWALQATVSTDCCLEKQTLTEAQRIAFYELALQHGQVPRELMPSLLATAERQQSMRLAAVIKRGAEEISGRPDAKNKVMGNSRDSK